jgi:ferredoxin
MEELYIIVDKEVCVNCGSCQAWSPDVFAYDEKSTAYNRLDNNTGTFPIPREIWADVLPTKYLCPTRAIKHSNKPHLDFVPTLAFWADSPDNPDITYAIEDGEWEKNEL